MEGDKSHIYILKADGTNYTKIGRTSDIAKRLETLQTGCPYNLVPIGFWLVDRATEMEMFLHWQLRKYRVRLEWFDLPESVLTTVKKNLKSVAHECSCSVFCTDDVQTMDDEFNQLFRSAVAPEDWREQSPLMVERVDLNGIALSRTDKQLNRVGQVAAGELSVLLERRQIVPNAERTNETKT